MKKLVLAALATTALTGTAFASDAFIGQVGSGHNAANIQLNQGTSQGLALIYQESTAVGHDALQVQIGPDNYAYSYQKGEESHTVVAWQEGTGNSSVNVQRGNTAHRAAVLQKGDNNTAVNWQAAGLSGLSAAPTMGLTVTPPELTVGTLTGVTLPGGSVDADINNHPGDFTEVDEPSL